MAPSSLCNVKEHLFRAIKRLEDLDGPIDEIQKAHAIAELSGKIIAVRALELQNKVAKD